MQAFILPNTEKHVLGAAFDERKEISLVGARGERIAFQVFVTKAHNVHVHADYDTEVFSELYIPVTVPSGPCPQPEHEKPVYVPDPILEFDRAVEAGENNGELLLWCFVDISRDETRRTFDVTLTVSADEGRDEVTAHVTVFDFELPKENRNVTAFVTRGDMIDAKDEAERLKKFDALVDFGLQYGCSPSNIVPEGVFDLPTVLERIEKYARDPRCASFSLPYRTTKEIDPVSEKEIECLDTVYLCELYTAMANASTNECNLFRKANMYVGFIDEPTPENFFRVRRVYREIHDLKREIAKSCDFSHKREVEAALLTMDNIVTVFNKEPIYGEVDTWCPTYWAYHKPEYVYEEKKLRGLGKKNWWYGCCAPWTPFPNLHTDSPMGDSRFESWLRYKFDVKGNLYWATNLTQKHSDGKYFDCDILNEAMLFPSANGDGLLFYTDTKYGAPMPSLRLFSMYLGLQEYEYFVSADDAARCAIPFYGKAFDMRAMFKPVFDRMAVGTTLVRKFDAEYLRAQIGKRVELAEKNIFVECDAHGTHSIVRVYSPKGVKINGRKGEESVCGRGVCSVFYFDGSDMLEADISVGEEKLLLAEKRTPISVEKAVSQSEKVSVCALCDKTVVHVEPFVNEEKIALYVPVVKDGAVPRTVELDIETLSGDAFILNTVLIDCNGNRYHAGYAVAEENRRQRISIGVTDVAQNRLNSIEDVEIIKRKEENGKISENFRFDRIVGVEILLQNNIKLLDDNRERRLSQYDFAVYDGYLTVEED